MFLYEALTAKSAAINPAVSTPRPTKFHRPHRRTSILTTAHRDSMRRVPPGQSRANPHCVGSREPFNPGLRRLGRPNREEDRHLVEVRTPYSRERYRQKP